MLVLAQHQSLSCSCEHCYVMLNKPVLDYKLFPPQNRVLD